MTNFGVRPFLDSFLKMAQKPTSRNSNKGDIEPASDEFSGLFLSFRQIWIQSTEIGLLL